MHKIFSKPTLEGQTDLAKKSHSVLVHPVYVLEYRFV